MLPTASDKPGTARSKIPRDSVPPSPAVLRNMAQCLSLGKNLHDNGFGKFREFLAYKLEDRGKQLIKIDKFFPSSKTCSNCGHYKDNLQLSDRIYHCDNCGCQIDRDKNAAINIKNQGLIVYKFTLNPSFLKNTLVLNHKTHFFFR